MNGMSLPKKLHSTGVLTAEEWINLPDKTGEGIVFGSLVDEIIEAGTKNIVEGAAKSFKTTFMLSLLLPASMGKTAWPQMPLFAGPRRVLYFHGELNSRQIGRRTRSAARGLEGPLENFYLVRDLDAHFINSRGQTTIEVYVRQVNPTDVVFDPWQSFIKGFDENTFVDISKATSFIDRLIDQYGVTVWIPTHTGKDTAKGTRGHSSLDGWRDARIKLSRRKCIVTAAIEPRWAESQEPFQLRFDDGQLVPAGEQVWSPQVAKVRGLVVLNGGAMPRTDLGSQLGLDGDPLRKVLYRAKEEGAITYSVDTVEVPSSTGDEVLTTLDDDGGGE